LIDAYYNEADGLVVVLDNRTTAMTGHQGHPGTGLRPDRSQGRAVDIQKLCQGIGVRCATVDARDYGALDAALQAEVDAPGLGVVIALAPCVLMVREKAGEIVVDDERCNLCGLCLDLGCPALAPGEQAVAVTDVCTGCGLCLEVCQRGVLSHAGASGAGRERDGV
jgi:indolepyruvate ferredoxin oxidoreductase alpha subunit